MQSPSRRAAGPLPSKVESFVQTPGGSRHPEPLLSLLTSHHPILSTAINGSLSAYSSSKEYSPRFKYGAEIVERLGSPVVSTVGTAGRISGVETGVRWWLQRSDSGGQDERSNKRRRVEDTNTQDMDVEKGLQDPSHQILAQRRMSDVSFGEPLPAYDDRRSPSYEETCVVTHPGQRSRSASNRNWQTRLIMSTSGLGVAMSEDSLRSLKYCLTWLRWANHHLGSVAVALKNLIEEWDSSQRNTTPSSDATMTEQHDTESGDQQQAELARDQATIAQHIQALKGEVLGTLKKVVDIVSTYAGGALPENARVLVRKHLTSLPQRFHIAFTTKANENSNHGDKPNSEIIRSAHRVSVLAKEGLDMMAQVSGVVDGTIVSAEEWCERFGRRRADRHEQESRPTIEAPYEKESQGLTSVGSTADG